MTNSNISDSSLQAFRRGLENFIPFEEAEWNNMIPYLEFCRMKKKDHFAVNGKVCDYIGFIIKGSVRHYHIKDGIEITGYFCFENEFVSAYKSFLTRQPAVNYIQALEPAEMIMISYKNMQLMLNSPSLSHKMDRFGRLVAEHYICCYEDRISSFITQSPEERYLNLLQTDGRILQRIPQHYIANFLGITPVSLSRIRKRTKALLNSYLLLTF